MKGSPVRVRVSAPQENPAMAGVSSLFRAQRVARKRSGSGRGRVFLPAVVALALVVQPGTAAAYRGPALEQAAYAFWGGRAVATCPDGIQTVKQAPGQDEAQADADAWA